MSPVVQWVMESPFTVSSLFYWGSIIVRKRSCLKGTRKEIKHRIGCGPCSGATNSAQRVKLCAPTGWGGLHTQVGFKNNCQPFTAPGKATESICILPRPKLSFSKRLHWRPFPSGFLKLIIDHETVEECCLAALFSLAKAQEHIGGDVSCLLLF